MKKLTLINLFLLILVGGLTVTAVRERSSVAHAQTENAKLKDSIADLNVEKQKLNDALDRGGL